MIRAGLQENEQEKLCQHCRTPLSASLEAFCCTGCEMAHAIIQGGGWQQYYRVRERESARPVDQAAPLSFDYLGTDDYRERHTRAFGKDQITDWYLDGLRCGACSWLVEQVAGSHKGIVEATLNFSSARLTLRFTADANLVALASTLNQLGYSVGLSPQAGALPPRSLLKLGLTGALAGNLMLMSLPFYAGLEQDTFGFVFGAISFVLALILLLYGAREYFVRASYALRHRLPGLDLPIALGLSGAFSLSTFNLVAGNYDGMYFDSMGMLVFFLMLGRNARESGIARAMAASRRLLARMPQLVQVHRAGTWQQLPAQELVPGDRLRLRTGDVLPLDAVLENERATLNLHVVSGESRPVEVIRGDRMLAGAVNMGGILEARASSAFNDSRFARLQEVAQGLQDNKSADSRHRLAWIFLALALGSALVGAALWWNESPLHGLSVALTVLIVVCPCALALAQPVAEAFALKYAATMGAWIKNTDVLARLALVDRVVFDKTGILTKGVPEIVRRDLLLEAPHWLEAAIAALEAQVNHPLAHAFKLGEGPRPTITRIEDVQVFAGAGLAGEVDGQRLVVGSPARLACFGLDADVISQAEELASDFPSHQTLVAAALNGKLAGLFGLEDRLRLEAPALVRALAEQHLQQTVLSGDDPGAVSRLAAEVGLSQWFGHMLPEQKLRFVADHSPETTLMVGDGFNDMGALARAGVGVTHAMGSEAALRFSGIIFKDRELGRLAHLFELARTTKDAVKRGVVVSLAYNLLAVVLALKGIIGPLGAALLMPLSSLSLIALIALTFRLRSRTWAF